MLEVIFMTPIENSSVVKNDTQGSQKYPHHRKQLKGRTSMREHGTKTTLVFLPADGEDSQLVLSKFSLLTIRRHSATRKQLLSYTQGDRSGQRKPKKDKHQQ